MTRAAERLGIQQPPLSQQIQALERELNVELFKRVARGVELTVGGASFLQDVQAILRQVEGAARKASRIASGVEGILSVAFSTSAAAQGLVPRIIRAFRQSYPNVALEFKEGSAAEITDWVSTGTTQAGIFRAPVSRPPGIVFHEMLRETMCVVLPVKHRLARSVERRASVALSSLRDEAFILVRRPGAPGMYADFVSVCRDAGFTPRIVAEVNRMLTNICLVAAGVGISVVPVSMQGFHRGTVAYLKLRGAPHLSAPLTLVYREGELNPATLRFVSLAKDLTRDSGRRAAA